MANSNYTKEDLEFIKNATAHDLAASILITHLENFNVKSFNIFTLCRDMLIHLMQLLNDELITETKLNEVEKELQKLLHIYINDLIMELAKKEAKKTCK